MRTSFDSILKEITSIREELHIHPELSYKEYETTNFIEKTIHSWGLVFNRFKNLETGGYCDVGEGELIVFRSDIDALPIDEDSSHKIVSQNKGVMHACGHDYHTALGLGILKYFSEKEKQLKKRIRVIFQPAEEAAPGGAEYVIQEKVLENVQAAIAVHVDPSIEVSKIIVIEGPVQASSTSIHIEFLGKGGHTSQPSETTDLINIAAFYITQIQSAIKQNIDSRETVAFAFGAINGGSTHNIIPQQIILRGTIRTHNNQILDKCLSIMKSFTKSFAKLYGIQINLKFPTNCLATINSPELVKAFVNYMKDSGNKDDLVIGDKPSMGADDFAFYGLNNPALYLMVGAKGRGSLHCSELVLNDDLLRPTFFALTGFIESL